MGPNGLSYLLPVFGNLPHFPCISNINEREIKLFEAFKIMITEMESILAEYRIQISLQS